MAEKSGHPPLVGALTILVIFGVMCLSVFSVLALKTAQYTVALAEQNAQAVTAYYQADSTCTQRTNRLYEAWQSGDGQGSMAALLAPWSGAITQTADGLHLAWSCPIDESRVLQVGIVAGESFRVETWSVTGREDWTGEDAITVWQGEDLGGPS